MKVPGKMRKILKTDRLAPPADGHVFGLQQFLSFLQTHQPNVERNGPTGEGFDFTV